MADTTTLVLEFDARQALSGISNVGSALDKVSRQFGEFRQKADIGQQFNSAASSMNLFSSALTKVGGVLAAYFAADKIVDFGKESVKAFSDLQEETQKFGVVFSGLGKQSEAVVKELQESYGQSELSARKMLASTGDLLSGFGFGREEALKMAEQVAKLGSDLASFSNYAGGAEGAAEALTKAMLGETEQAKMLGIAIKTDTPEYKALVDGIKAANNVTDIQAKAMAALQIAYSQSGNAIGDFKRNMDSIANQGRIFENSMIDLKTSVGGFLDELFNIAPLTGGIGGKIKELSAYIKENSKEWALTIKMFALDTAEAAEKIGVYFEPVFSIISAGIQNIVSLAKFGYDSFVAIWGNIPGFFDAVFEDGRVSIKNAMDFVVTLFTSTFDLGANILSSFGKNWRGIFSDLWEITKRTVSSIGDYFVAGIKNIGMMAQSLGKNFWDLITGKKKFSEAVGSIFDDYIKGLKNIEKEVGKNWEGFEFGKSSKQFGADVAREFEAHMARIGESGAKYLADYGRNTELFLKNSGVKMPTFKSADFSAWTDSGYREQRFNDISGRYEGLRSKLSEDTKKAEEKISAGGSKLAGALNETAEKVKSTSKAFVVSSFDAFEKGSLEAAKAESVVFERNTDPIQKESDKIKKSGMVLSDSMLQASNAVKAAAKTFSFGLPAFMAGNIVNAAGNIMKGNIKAYGTAKRASDAVGKIPAYSGDFAGFMAAQTLAALNTNSGSWKNVGDKALSVPVLQALDAAKTFSFGLPGMIAGNINALSTNLWSRSATNSAGNITESSIKSSGFNVTAGNKSNQFQREILQSLKEILKRMDQDRSVQQGQKSRLDEIAISSRNSAKINIV